MATATASTDQFKHGTRVTVTRDLRGVPEGTEGTIRVASGLTWMRYWVEFDNGVYMGSVGHELLVEADDWEDFKRRRAEEAAKPKETEKPAEAAASSGDGADAASGPASKVPAHLLERSKAARAKKAGG